MVSRAGLRWSPRSLAGPTRGRGTHPSNTALAGNAAPLPRGAQPRSCRTHPTCHKCNKPPNKLKKGEAEEGFGEVGRFPSSRCWAPALRGSLRPLVAFSPGWDEAELSRSHSPDASSGQAAEHTHPPSTASSPHLGETPASWDTPSTDY